MSNSKGKNFSSRDASRLTDEPTKTLLFKVLQYLERNPLLSFGFDLKEYTIAAAGTDIPLAHSLGYPPKDIILTSKTGSGSVTINYDLTSDTYIYITTTDATKIRVLIGSYRSEV